MNIKQEEASKEATETEIKFSDFNFKKELQKAISDARYTTPSPVQEKSIPIILNGKDLISQAQTGTGKTAAFGLPIIEMMDGQSGVELLVIVPTRELAMQVSDELWKFTRLLGYRTTSVFGGSSYKRQISFIESSSIVVATPGRLLDLLEKKQIQINPKFVVLDEADEMLNMGFIVDIKKIFNLIPKQRQTLMFSATMPDAIKILAKEILNDPSEVKITPQNISNENIKQYFYILDEDKRKEALLRLLEIKKPYKSIIFCRTKIETEKVNKFLLKNNIQTLALHGDIEQRKRQEITKKFKSRDYNLLVATDVAARGLDIKNVSHVFNYHIPQNSEPYVHRIGRTGRAGKIGEAHTFVTFDEVELLKDIQIKVKSNIIASEIPSSASLIEAEFDKIIPEILKQKITNEGLELISKLLKNNTKKEELLEQLASFLVQEEKKQITNLSLPTIEAQKIVEEFKKKRKTASNSKRFSRNKKPFQKKNNFRKQENNYRWR